MIDSKLQYIFDNFYTTGKPFIKGSRNEIKLFDYENIILNVKSFKSPVFFNKIIYRFFRKSKAKRSYQYATILKEKNIGTPNPIAYYEKYDFIGLTYSYYASEHIDFDIMFRDLIENEDYPNSEIILQQFTAFCYKMHLTGVEFLDHSPGNTLIKKVSDEKYDFYLVDLNRMKFHDTMMSLKKRMKNLSRLTPHKKMVKTISIEYAKLTDENENEVFNLLWYYTRKFQKKYYRKKNFKNKIKKIFC